jgi:hypothetical protein
VAPAISKSIQNPALSILRRGGRAGCRNLILTYN